jgi:hypothetical protein
VSPATAPELLSELGTLATLTRPKLRALLPLLHLEHASVAAVERTALVTFLASEIAPVAPDVTAQHASFQTVAVVVASILPHALAAFPTEMSAAVVAATPTAVPLRRRPDARAEDERQEDDERTYRPQQCTKFKSHFLLPPCPNCLSGRVLPKS